MFLVANDNLAVKTNVMCSLVNIKNTTYHKSLMTLKISFNTWRIHVILML